MDSIQRLVAAEQIRDLKARYCRAIDTKDWSLLARVFADDVECDYRGAATDPATGVNLLPAATESLLRGQAEAIEALKRALTGVVSAHQGFFSEIEMTGETSAKAIWAMHDSLRFPESAPLAGMSGDGHYHETYEHRDNSWRIKTLKLVRLRVDGLAR